MPWSDPRDRPPRVDVSLLSGYVVPTDWSDLVLLGSISPATGVLEQVLLRELRVEPGQTLGASATYWRAKYGFRVNVSRSEGTLVSAGSPQADVDSWFYDIRGAIGMVDYAPARVAWPYFFVGFGAVTYDLSRAITPPLTNFIEHQPSPPIQGQIIVDRGGHQFLVEVDELDLETEFTFSIGVGTDFRIPFGGGGVGVRLEAGDQIARSPIGVRLHDLGGFGQPASTVVIRSDAVHHFHVSAGLVIQFGR